MIDKHFPSIKLTFFIMSFFFFYFNACYGLPFTIIPNGPLPTFVNRGTQVLASYVVINNTQSFRMNNFVKYLPPNVSLSSGSCTDNFNLAPNGSPGDRCILNLLVSGAVNGYDPNPQHHLFVCFPGGKSCAGTQFPLNVIPLSGNQNFTTVGFSYDSNFQSFPLAYFSQDGGSNWLLSSIPPPQDGEQGELFGVSCVGNNCTSVGIYFDFIKFFSLPIGYTSLDGGMTWSRSETFPPPSDIIFDAGLTSVSCTSQFCTAVGSYGRIGFPPSIPFAYKSTNYGKSWILANTFPLPSNLIEGGLQGVACVSNQCAAVGGYFDGSSVQQFGYTSQNGGLDWTPSLIDAPSGQLFGNLVGITCNTNHCIAVGVTSVNFDNPAIYISDNTGATWTFLSSIALPTGFIEGDLHGVACLENVCLAVGDGNTDTGPVLPIVYRSTDGGVSWLPIVLSLPAGFEGGLLGIACQDGICNAVGSVTDLSNNIEPVSFQTTDTGLSWHMTSFQAFTNGLIGGNLNGVSGAQSFIKRNEVASKWQKRHEKFSIRSKRSD